MYDLGNLNCVSLKVLFIDSILFADAALTIWMMNSLEVYVRQKYVRPNVCKDWSIFDQLLC